MRKCVVFGGIAAALAFAPVGAVCAAGDYEAPSGIELSIGDIEIDRADLSGGRLLEVPVSISNNSGFVSVEMLIELDGRLRFDEEMELGTRAGGMSGIHISHYMGMDNTVTAKFVTLTKTRFTEDGEIGFLRVVLPEGTPEGRYDISLSPSPDENMLLTYNSFDAWFGSECFSQLRGGSITVRDREAEAQREQSRHEENVQSNEAAQNSGSSDNNEKSTEPAAEVTTTVTETQTTTASKTIVTSAAASTAAKSSTSRVTTSKATTTVSAVISSSSAESENTQHKRNNLLLPVIAATVIVLGTACFIVRKGGRSK